MPEKALLDDIHFYVINFYQWLKKELKLEIENEWDLYYRFQEWFCIIIYRENQFSVKPLRDVNKRSSSVILSYTEIDAKVALLN